MEEARERELARQLAELAVNNPERLPVTILEFMVRSLMVAVAGIIEDRMARALGDWEGILNAHVNVNDKGGQPNGRILPE